MTRARIRRASGDDAAAIAALAREHARFERGEACCGDAALRAALDAAPSLLLGWLATHDKEAIGYATATIDFSTWRAALYLHLDCLFVRAEWRGRGIGARLVEAAARHAGTLNVEIMEWQTPGWNRDAIRFYERLGAARADKARFRLDVPRTPL